MNSAVCLSGDGWRLTRPIDPQPGQAQRKPGKQRLPGPEIVALLSAVRAGKFLDGGALRLIRAAHYADTWPG